ncbi:MAG: hypothetical protein M3R17_02435 [Bacteroidota bacterium]|nr:hypothetical protein [Bacteroidota bacterium]
MKTRFCCILISLTMITACSEDSGKEKDIFDDTASGNKVQISREVLDEMIRTLPQPIEIADIISKANLAFSKDMLLPSENSSKYSDKYFQSLAFGAYGVDLGYINLNEKTLYTLEYLESIKTLSEDIKVDQFFDFSTLAELAKNRNNADSLIQISTKNFNKIDEFLREKNRGELSVLILIGSWIEGMHMFAEIHKTNPEISTRIGEQKIIFENISALIEKLSTIDHFKMMKNDFKVLKTAYDSVEINTIYRQPETKEVNGELIIIDKSEMKVSISEVTVTNIIAGIEAIRNKYLVETEK